MRMFLKIVYRSRASTLFKSQVLELAQQLKTVILAHSR